MCVETTIENVSVSEPSISHIECSDRDSIRTCPILWMIASLYGHIEALRCGIHIALEVLVHGISLVLGERATALCKGVMVSGI